MKVIVANGDSHTYGEGLQEDDLTFADIVAKHFNKKLFNIARSGCSNDCILRKGKRELYSTNTFMLVGWTSWEREEWLHNGRYHQINSSANVTKELQQQYKEWVSNLSFKDMVIKSQFWHNRIWDYHLQLRAKGIKHLFFNSFTPFMSLDTSTDLIPLKRYNWDKQFIMPYLHKGTYLDHLTIHNYEPDNEYHFKSDGHKFWADYLIQHIEEHNLI